MSTKGILIAVKNNEFQELSIYLSSDNDGDTNTKDAEGWTLLHYAVINENVDMVKVLLKNGADPTQVNNKGETPLHIAARKGCMEIVNLLLKHATICRINYVDTKTTPHEDTPLHIAAKNGFIDVVISLLSHGAIYDIKNKDDQTPLDLSKAYNVTKILALIQESFEKAKNGDVQIIDKLKEADLDEFSAIMNSRNCQNRPLIQEAMTNNRYKLTAKLLAMRVDVDCDLDTDESRAPVEPYYAESKVNFTSFKDKLDHLRRAAEQHLKFSALYLPMLKTMSEPYGLDRNLSPWKTLKDGSYLLGNTEDLVYLYKKYMPGEIDDEDIKLVNDTLVHLQFDGSHIGSGYTPEAYGGEVECFVSQGQGTVYYNMLHSDMNKDVRVFIDIVEKNLDTPVKRFLETTTQKLKNFL